MHRIVEVIVRKIGYRGQLEVYEATEARGVIYDSEIAWATEMRRLGHFIEAANDKVMVVPEGRWTVYRERKNVRWTVRVFELLL